VIPRRLVFLGIAALILAAAGIAAAATHEDDDTPAVLGPPVTTTTSARPADTTSTVVAVTSTTAAPAPTTTVAGATTTTRRGATTTTTRAGATTTSTGPVVACTTAQIEAAVSTDKASYAQTEPVKIHSTLRNRSATTCSFPSFVFGATVLSPGGATVTGFSRQGDAPGALGSGQANEASVTWERLGCAPQPCVQNTPGRYSVSVTWHFPGGPYTATASFDLT
jgi:cytoskeletal protein RodZ